MREYPVLLETRALTAGYDRKPVVREADIVLHAGEVLVLIGPNGAGKSTLLKSIAMQLIPMAGTVCLEGKDMKSMRPDERARHMSVLLTGRKDTEWMTCREMASAGRFPYTGRLGILSDKDRGVVDRSLRRMGALELSELRFNSISDGQKQRVLLARALCQEPEVLVLDEPASYLDIRYQLELAEALRSLAHDEKMAVIVSLHELDLVKRCADRIVCLKDGHVDRIGSAGEIFAGDYLERLFDLPPGSLEGTEGTPGISPESIPSRDDHSENRFEHYVHTDGKRMRCGYTTGTCAALAAAGASEMLLLGRRPETVSLVTPKGWKVSVPLEETDGDSGHAVCGVRKDAGDDADVTDGLLIKAEVRISDTPGIRINGGPGVGRVTKPGLDQSPGEAAINSVPRRMITEAVEAVIRTADYAGGLDVTIMVPGGEEAAKKTFNPELGIVGGISILGTSGIVEPMSRQALVDTITLELRQNAEMGHKRVILVPGNYGMEFLREQGYSDLGIPVVKCSNFIGDALDACGALGFDQVLLCGHAGKLIKLAAGVMNTHSRQADGRREIFCAYAAVSGASGGLCRKLMEAATADACISLLKEAALLSDVSGKILPAVQRHLDARVADFDCGAVIFSREHGLFGMTEKAYELIREWTKERI